MASTLSLVILQAIVLVVSSADREVRVNESFHRGGVPQIGTRKIIWPHWSRERWARVQERENDWNRLWNYKNDVDVETTIATAPTIGSSMRPVVRTNATRPDKFGAIAVAEYAGTRAIAYAGFHEDHRHRALPETATRDYQRILTTTPTYTRHHSGYVPGISVFFFLFLIMITYDKLSLLISLHSLLLLNNIISLFRAVRLPLCLYTHQCTKMDRTNFNISLNSTCT